MNQPLILPEQAQQPQPTFPAINFQVTPDSAIFTFALGNGLAIQQVLNAEAMQQICKIWLESRKELHKQQQLVADVIRTKR